MESSEGFSVSNDRTILKRKRTNRPRPPPPPSTTSSSSAATHSFSNSYSPTTSSAISVQDEDMANCLILLARGRHSPPPASAGTYECKTCGKSFPSFQALGGHRASHKKPKNNNNNSNSITADPKKSPPESTAAQPSDEEEAQFAGTLINTAPPILDRRTFPQPDPNKAKIHECSVCGSEFGSGQALGGHMRRHRPPPTTAATFEDNGVKSKTALTIDLNLPAPQEDDRFRQLPSDPTPHLGFAAAALVDCHY